MKTLKAVILGALAASMFMLGSVVSVDAHAYAKCTSTGVLCFQEKGLSAIHPASNSWGAVKDSNKDWRAFGWNDTADYFINKGLHCSVRLYEHIDYKGANKPLPRGFDVTWSNIVSSNQWYACD